MFDYPLSILVGQKTNSHPLRQNLFPALRARRRAEFVRQEAEARRKPPGVRKTPNL
jgi:hypothetical protein